MSEREKCTKENPSDGTAYKWYHPEANFINSYDSSEEGESYDEYKCPHCEITFKVYVLK